MLQKFLILKRHFQCIDTHCCIFCGLKLHAFMIIMIYEFIIMYRLIQKHLCLMFVQSDEI